MSFAEDLHRNRKAYQTLTGGSEPEKEHSSEYFLEQRPIQGYEESGFVPEPRFSQLQREMIESPSLPNARSDRDKEAGVYRIAMDEHASVDPPMEKRAVSLQMTKEAESVEYPQSQIDPIKAGGDNLLDSLVRKLEQNARKYPQELREEGMEW